MKNVPREDLIQACTVYEPTYSPYADVARNDISCRVLQHQLQINEALVSTVAALMESYFPQGATIYWPLPVRLKLLTTGLTSTRCLDLSVSCAVALSPISSLRTLKKNLPMAAFDVIGGIPSTPTHVRSSLYYFPQIFALRASFKELLWGPTSPSSSTELLFDVRLQRPCDKSQRTRQAPE